jgi:hypothetical protein
MNDQISKLEKIRDLIQQAIINFPQLHREDILFGEWNLKDLIAHLNNWMEHDIDCLNAVKENRIPLWEPNTDEFNERGTQARKNLSWNNLCAEFTNLSNQLIGIYKEYPSNLLSINIWPDHPYETPLTFISSNINHWTLELNNIKSKL